MILIKKEDQCIFEFPRKVNEILWYSIMRYYDIKKKVYKDSAFFGDNPDYIIDTPTFCVRAYNWNEADENISKDNIKDFLYNHNNDWHFWHKPSGLKIQWYKYPLRDAYINMKIGSDKLEDVLYDCQNSLHPRFTHGIDEWWNDAFFYSNDMIISLAETDAFQAVIDKNFNCCLLKNGDMYAHRIESEVNKWELDTCGMVSHAKVFPQTSYGYIDKRLGVDAEKCKKVVSLLCGNNNKEDNNETLG